MDVRHQVWVLGIVKLLKASWNISREKKVAPVSSSRLRYGKSITLGEDINRRKGQIKRFTRPLCGTSPPGSAQMSPFSYVVRDPGPATRGLDVLRRRTCACVLARARLLNAFLRSAFFDGTKRKKDHSNWKNCRELSRRNSSTFFVFSSTRIGDDSITGSSRAADVKRDDENINHVYRNVKMAADYWVRLKQAMKGNHCFLTRLWYQRAVCV